jgi:hypothetical protein
MPKTDESKSGLSPEQEAAVVEAVARVPCRLDAFRNNACKVAAAHTRALEGVGYVNVPAEPTDDMVNAEFDEPAHRLPLTADEVCDIWRAMVAASPPLRTMRG